MSSSHPSYPIAHLNVVPLFRASPLLSFLFPTSITFYTLNPPPPLFLLSQSLLPRPPACIFFLLLAPSTSLHSFSLRILLRRSIGVAFLAPFPPLPPPL